MPSTVLIVDDTAFMRMTLRRAVEQGGYKVIGEANDGAVAVAMYKQLKPDVVLMDITMPVTNGVVATQEIREYDADARIIICNAMGQKDVVLEALRAGAIDFVTKPLEAKRLTEALSTALL